MIDDETGRLPGAGATPPAEAPPAAADLTPSTCPVPEAEVTAQTEPGAVPAREAPAAPAGTAAARLLVARAQLATEIDDARTGKTAQHGVAEERLAELCRVVDYWVGEDMAVLVEPLGLLALADEVKKDYALTAFTNPDRLRVLLSELLAAFGIGSLNLLCDEAAQYFKPEFQPLFFSVLKSVHTEAISFKAAIYPTLTYFGADFELGHDATVVPLTRPCLSPEWLQFCRGIIERRSRDPRLWEAYPVFLEALAYTALGVPRRFIELVGSLSFPTASELDVLNAIKSHAQRELLQPFDVLKARIPGLVREVELASYLLHLFLDDLKQENTTRTYPTAYVAVSKHRALPFAVRKALNLLVYLGVLERQAPCKLGHSRETADRLLINPALIVSENLFADASKRRLSLRDTNERLRQLELERFKEYGRNSKALQEAVEEARSVETKPCPQCGVDLPFEARFCTNCGAAQNQRNILSQILALPSTELNLTPGIKARVTERFATVRAVFEASDAALDAIHFIGPTRVAIIRHAVDELIAG